jgi:hypothetical protein
VVSECCGYLFPLFSTKLVRRNSCALNYLYDESDLIEEVDNGGFYKRGCQEETLLRIRSRVVLTSSPWLRLR